MGLFGSKKAQKREGAMDVDKAIEQVKTFAVHDMVTVTRINWDGSETVVTGRVSHVGKDGKEFALVEEGTDEPVSFHVDDLDISKLQRMAISIDLDETHSESYMEVDKIVEVLEALEHGDTITVSFYDPYKGKGVALKGAITLKDEYNKLFAIEYDLPGGEKEEYNFDLTKDRIIDIIID